MARDSTHDRGGCVVVVGNAGFDLRLAVPRLPLPGETLIGLGDTARLPGGKGLNQAVVAARCGVPVRFCAALGADDGDAEEIGRWLVREGIATALLPRHAAATDFSLLMVLPDGENSIVSTSACSKALTAEQAMPMLEGLGARDLLLLQGNLSPETTAALLTEARRRGLRTVLNTAPFWPGLETLVGQCSLVIANRVEASALGTAIAGSEAAIVTLGEEGCILHQAGRRTAFAAESVNAVDTTGCGDAFCGVVAAALASGQTLEPAIVAAQRAAALTATRAGAFAALPRSDELRAILAAGLTSR